MIISKLRRQVISKNFQCMMAYTHKQALITRAFIKTSYVKAEGQGKRKERGERTGKSKR